VAISGPGSSTRQVYVALVIFSVAMLGAMGYALQTGARVSAEHSPLVRASARIKLDATLAHLWFEEILSGDRHESMDEVRRLLRSARFYTLAMVEGGEDSESTIVPLDDPRLREKIRVVERKLTEFERITDQRRAAREGAISGTEIDQTYDAVFGELIAVADEVERELHQIIRQDIRSVSRAQIFVIAGGVILSVLVGVFFARYIHERGHAERTLELKVQAEKEAREHLGRLAHVVRLGTMSELAAEIAHEINQPLAAACRRLVDAGREQSAEFRSALALIDSESNRASDVLRRLRTFIGRRDGCFACVDVNELVRGVVKLAGFDPQMRRASVRLELAGDLPTAEADSVQIQQVLLNLLRNGLEAMDDSEVEGQGIVVRTRVDDGRAIEISVVDRGAGLPTEEVGDPFRAFFTTKESGMGMGLSISQSIISAHGGRIWCRRDDEAGNTTFAFTLPTAELGRS